MAPEFGYHITLESRGNEVERLFAFLQQSLLGEVLHTPSEEVINDLKVVAEEWLANVIDHGYGKDGSGTLDIDLSIGKNRIEIAFRDHAVAFNPLNEDNREVSSDYSEGGMGLTIIRSLTDSRHYAREGEHNVFTLTKHYNPVNPD
jgi:anti-sigma regulatory factor (Ser/Thr protein kinase)